MSRSCGLLTCGCLLLVSCNGNIDFEGILQQVADQLQAPAGATGAASVLAFSNISPQTLSGTLEVFWMIEGGETRRSTAFVEVPPDFSTTFDVGCPSSVQFTASLGQSPFSLKATRDVDYQCGQSLEFAAGPGSVVQFFSAPL